jgi:hypothetical protein
MTPFEFIPSIAVLPERCAMPRAMLALDRACARFASGHDAPTLSADDPACTRDALRPLYGAAHQPTCLSARSE